MIRYALVCDRGHEFESWFQDSAAYEKQAKRALVNCPQCGSTKVEKAIMAPRLSANARKQRAPVEAPAPATDVAAPVPAAPVAMISPQEQEFRSKLKELHDHLTKNADHVGAKFTMEKPSTARSMVSLRLRKRKSSPRKASNSIPCRFCRTSGTSAAIRAARHRSRPAQPRK